VKNHLSTIVFYHRDKKIHEDSRRLKDGICWRRFFNGPSHKQQHSKSTFMTDIRSLIRTIPNYPKDGIMFRDITTLIKDPVGFQQVIDQLNSRYKNTSIDYIVGIEARGFILGAALAYTLKKGFVPIRKKGKLPGKTISQSYDLEYGSDTMEIHEDALVKGSKVLLIDDLIATGGTAIGALTLLDKIGGVVVETAFVVDLPELGGAKKIQNMGHKVFSLCEFSGH